jgi:hypothetical protein
MGTLLLIILILLLVGALPTWPHARSWGSSKPLRGRLVRAVQRVTD